MALVALGTARGLLATAAGQEALHEPTTRADVRNLLLPFLDRKASGTLALFSWSAFFSHSSGGPSSPPAPPQASSAAVAEHPGQPLHGQPRGSAGFASFLSVAAFSSRAVWAPGSGRSFEDWVCDLTGRLLHDCYPVPISQAREAGGFAGSAEGGALSPVADECGLVGGDDFLRLCRPLALRLPKLAEMLFPAIADDLTRFASPEGRRLVSQCISEHLLDCGGGGGEHLKAMQLALHTVRLAKPLCSKSHDL